MATQFFQALQLLHLLNAFGHNFAVQVFALGTYLWQGMIDQSHLPYMAVLIVFVSIPAILGAKLFYKISELLFKRIILSLLFSAGCFLIASQFI